MRVLPCRAMPFISAAIENSRMPKWTVRPYGSASGSGLPAGRKELVPSMVVLFDPARSAEPPHSSGSTGPRACSTLPEAARVATALPSSNTGRASSQPSGSSPLPTRSKRAARSGSVARHSAIRLSQAACASAPRSSAPRVCLRTSSVTSKDCSGSKPTTRLVAAISSAPSAEPWEASVFCAFGAGQAMIVRIAMIEGRPVSACADFSASYNAGTSMSPSAVGSMRRVCQP